MFRYASLLAVCAALSTLALVGCSKSEPPVDNKPAPDISGPAGGKNSQAAPPTSPGELPPPPALRGKPQTDD